MVNFVVLKKFPWLGAENGLEGGKWGGAGGEEKAALNAKREVLVVEGTEQEERRI